MGREQANEFYIPAIQGQQVPEEHRTGWNPQTVVTDPGPGSDNYQTLWASNAAWWGYHHDRQEMHRVLDAWAGYAEIPFMQDEVFTAHVYLPWKEDRAAAVRGLAVHVGRDDVAEEMLPLLRTFRALAALSSGWQRRTTGTQYLRGYPVMMTGARSFASSGGPNDNRRYDDGYPYDPFEWMVGYGSFASWMLDRALGYVTLGPEWDAIRHQLGPSWWEKCYGVEAEEKAALRRICRNEYNAEDLELALDSINDGPRFKIPAQIVRTGEAVLWLNERSINAGSTHFMYGKVWYHDRRPRNSYWDSLRWQTDPQVGWLVADTSMRKNGRNGRAELIERGGKLIARCQNNNGTWHHIEQGDKPGWFEVEIPGHVELHVKIHKRNAGSVQPNATLVGVEDPIDPPEPPEPPADKPGKKRLRAAARSIDRAIERWNRAGGPRQARKAIRQINQALERRQR